VSFAPKNENSLALMRCNINGDPVMDYIVRRLFDNAGFCRKIAYFDKISI
jgi:hypothetical protein